jgi:hypothetical protein
MKNFILSILAHSLKLLAFCLLFLFLSPPAFALNDLEVIYSFAGGANGSNPLDLLAGPSGVFYGVTADGGLTNPTNCPSNNGQSCGQIFKLSQPSSHGGTASLQVLYSFQGDEDGYMPSSPLIADKNGNLYGTTSFGGTGCIYQFTKGCGTVFQLSPPSEPNGQWTKTKLYEFTGEDNVIEPYGRLLIGIDGTLIGTTPYGGTKGNCPGGSCGAAYQLIPPTQPHEAWTEKTILIFNGTEGTSPNGDLIQDVNGTLYGTTSRTVNDNFGTVFELIPPSLGQTDWTENVLYQFGSNLKDGFSPTAGLYIDVYGNLYGTTNAGGVHNHNGNVGGTVFKLSPPIENGGPWTEAVIHSFGGKNEGPGDDGYYPSGKVTPGAGGLLFGTATYGDDYNDNCYQGGCGILFKLVPPSRQGGKWAETILYAFQGGIDGGQPTGSVLFPDGNKLVGVISSGPGAPYGNVFEFQ